MKYLLIILFVLTGLTSYSQLPTGVPVQKINGRAEAWYQQSDSATIIATRDTNWLPRFAGTTVLWRQASDTSLWTYTGQRWVKGLNSGSSLQAPVRWTNMLDAGCDTTGILDCSFIVASTLAAGQRYLYFPRGHYLFSSQIQMRDSVTIKGDGPGSTVIRLTTNIAAFRCGEASRGMSTQFLDFTIQGTIGSGGIDSTQRGILLDSAAKVYISNVRGKSLGGFAFTSINNGYNPNYISTHIAGNILSSVYVEDCLGGALFGDLGEYNSVTSSTFYRNTYGVKISGGNARVNNNNIVNNTYGIYLSGGPNNGHGVANDNTINHNTNNAYADGVSLGFLFSDNMMYSGNITINNSTGIDIRGGTIAGATVTVTNCTSCDLLGVRRTSPTSVTWNISGIALTSVSVGDTLGGLSINNIFGSSVNRFDIINSSPIVYFTGVAGSVSRFRFNSLVDVDTLTGGSTASESLTLMSTTNVTKGRILFGTASTYNEATDRLGIGTLNPGADIHVLSNSTVSTDVKIENTNASANSSARLLLTNNAGVNGQVYLGSSANSFAPSGVFMGTNTGTGGINFVAGAGPIIFRANQILGTLEYARFNINGLRLLVGSSTDVGQKFQVTGSAFFTDSVYSDKILFGGKNSGDSLWLSSTSNATKGKIKLGSLSDFNEVTQTLTIGDGATNTGAFIVLNSSTNGSLAFRGGARTLSTTATFTIDQPSTTSAVGADWITYLNVNHLQTSGIQNGLKSAQTFAPTSGTAVFNSYEFADVINQTGGANGISRTIHINPAITAAADYRALETERGKIIFRGITAGGATDSVMVQDNTTMELKKVARSSFSGSSSTAFGIDSTVISGTGSSVLFVSLTGKLAQDNAAFNYVDGNNALYVDSVRSLSVQSPLFLGGTGTTSSITYKTTKGTGAAGADHIWQVGTNGATEAMRILNNANVGIGKAAPEFKLHVEGTGAALGIVNTASPSASSGAGISAWVFGNPSAANQRLGYYAFGSKNSTTTQNYGAFIQAFSGAAWVSGSDMSTYMNFFTTPAGSGTSIEAMRINMAQEVQIGSTTDQGAFKLQNTGGFYQNGAVRMDIGSDATGDMYYRNATPVLARLAAGADSTVIRYIGGVPTVGPLVTSSTYVAALTGTANVSASTFSDAYYIRVGNIVTVNLVILIDPTVALTQTNLEISLPIASNFATGSDCSGQIITNDSGDQTYGVVFSSIANDRAVVSFVAGATASNATFRVHFSYKII